MIAGITSVSALGLYYLYTTYTQPTPQAPNNNNTPDNATDNALPAQNAYEQAPKNNAYNNPIPEASVSCSKNPHTLAKEALQNNDISTFQQALNNNFFPNKEYLLDALENNCTHIVCSIINSNPSLILLATNSINDSALHIACKKNNTEIACTLLQHNAAITTNAQGMTPFDYIYQNNNVTLAQALINAMEKQHGRSKNLEELRAWVASKQQEHFKVVSAYSAQELKTFIDDGGTVNIKQDGISLLLHACRQKNINEEFINILLQHHSISLADKQAILTYACDTNRQDIIKICIANKITPQASHINWICHYCNDIKVIQDAIALKSSTINEQNIFGNTPLHSACKRAAGDIIQQDIIACLLKHNTNTTITNKENKTALAILLEHGNKDSIQLLHSITPGTSLDLLTACTAGNLAAVEVLSASIPLTHVYTPNNNTLLHIAVESAKHPIVKFLVEQKVDINAHNQQKKSPLWYACERPSDYETAKILIDSGAIITKDDFLRALEYGCDKTTVYILQKINLNDRNAFSNSQDKDGNTPLHTACNKNMPETIRFLINNNAAVDSKNRQLKTPYETTTNAVSKATFEKTLTSHVWQFYKTLTTPEYTITENDSLYTILTTLYKEGDQRITPFINLLIKKGYYAITRQSLEFHDKNKGFLTQPITKFMLQHGATIYNNVIADPCVIHDTYEDKIVILMRFIALDTNNSIISNQKNHEFWTILQKSNLNKKQAEQLYIHAIIYSTTQPNNKYNLAAELFYRYPIDNCMHEFQYATPNLCNKARALIDTTTMKKKLLENNSYYDVKIIFNHN